MRIAVVGGHGFIGRQVSAQLRRAGHEVLVIGRGEPLRGADRVVHLALYNQADARAVVDGLRGRTARLVAISSGDVYRAYGQLLGSEPYAREAVPALDEAAPLRSQLYPYGQVAQGPTGEIRDYDKILVERVLRAAGPALPATVLRLAKVYGPGDRQRTFWPWIERMRAGEPIVLGLQQSRWRFTHGYVENVAAAITLATLADAAAGQIYNVGEPVTPTVRERVELLGRAVGWSGPIETVPDAELAAAAGAAPVARRKACYAPDLVLATDKIRSQLGYMEAVSMEQGLARTIRV